ncbi:hypothetical protein F4802DRAFT_72596 [Xylaria palmicola]|nr:hypothetical protein F4802DRAFT_72596 [Xylaria palmicola]
MTGSLRGPRPSTHSGSFAWRDTEDGVTCGGCYTYRTTPPKHPETAPFPLPPLFLFFHFLFSPFFLPFFLPFRPSAHPHISTPDTNQRATGHPSDTLASRGAPGGGILGLRLPQHIVTLPYPTGFKREPNCRVNQSVSLASLVYCPGFDPPASLVVNQGV